MTGYGVLVVVVFVSGLAYGGSWIVEQLRREAPTVQIPNVRPTRLDVLRARYVAGRIDVERFEAEVEDLVRDGIEHDPEPLPDLTPPLGPPGPLWRIAGPA